MRVDELLCPLSRLVLPPGRLLEKGIGIGACRHRLLPSAEFEPAAQLHRLDLRMKLNPEVAAEPERLRPDVVAGEELGPVAEQAAVVMKLEPGPLAHLVRSERLDCHPSDLAPRGALDAAPEGGREQLGSEADPEDGQPPAIRLVHEGDLVSEEPSDRAGVVDGPGRSEHDDVIELGERVERSLVGDVVGGEVRPARRERLADEPGGVLEMVAYDEHAH